MYVLVCCVDRKHAATYVRESGEFESLDVALYVLSKKKAGPNARGDMRTYSVHRKSDWAMMAEKK